jgi:hypothetical protein
MSAGVKVAVTSRDPSAVTSVIRHTVGAGSESRYEAWFREVTAIAQTFPGHRGVDFIRPPKGSPGTDPIGPPALIIAVITADHPAVDRDPFAVHILERRWLS